MIVCRLGTILESQICRYGEASAPVFNGNEVTRGISKPLEGILTEFSDWVIQRGSVEG